MKNLYITFLTLIATTGFAQTTIFSENFGTPSGTTAINANTFQNTTPILFSGTADIRTTTPSTNYTGASGNGCVFLASTTANRDIIIAGINSLNFTDLTLSFGHYKGTNASNNELLVSVSEDGTTWTPLTYTRPTGGGTSTWLLITPTGTIPATANLRVKFENPMSIAGFRIDDVKLVGTPEVLSNNKSTIAGLKIYPNPAKNTLFVTSNSFTAKTVELYDVVGKLALKTTTTNTPINLAGLTSGVYVIKVTEEGKTATRKLVIE
jgi:hypothetical protein